MLGLFLDARYGLLPYAPVYLLAAAGVAMADLGAARLRSLLPAAGVYYFTVAAADNWAGAVCNLGRYLMPLCPLAVAFVAVALARTAGRRGVLALVLALAAWTALLARALWNDPLAANDSWLLLAKSALADGNAYVPNLFIRTWADGAPGLGARVFSWLVLAGVLAAWLRRVARGQGGASVVTVLSRATALLLAIAFLLEQWSTTRRGPEWPNVVETSPALTVFATGPVVAREGVFLAEAGVIELLVRSAPPLSSLSMLAGGEGWLRLPQGGRVRLRPAGVRLELPLLEAAHLRDGEGSSEWLLRQAVEVDARETIVLRPESPEPRGPEER
jgi:hypothetical protein